MNRYLAGMQEEAAKLRAEARGILEGEGRSPEQETRLEQIDTRLGELNPKIEREQAINERLRQEPTGMTFQHVSDMHDLEAERPFKSFGEQLVAVYHAGKSQGANVDRRLLALNGAGESGMNGEGFLVQQEFTREALGRMYGTGQIMSRVRRRPIGAGANGLVINTIKETSRATGSRFGGIRMYWVNEGGTIIGSRPKYRRFSLNLEKVAGIYVPTDELLQDVVALEGEVSDQFNQELAFTCEDAVFEGDGAGKPLGLLNSPALISVDKEAGQAADTVVEENLVKMWGSFWANNRPGAVWLVNQEVEGQLDLIARPVGLGALPSQIVKYSPDGSAMTIYGRPVLTVEYASALGDQGDIVLTDLGDYRWIDKNGVQQASSIHVYFTTDEMAFRFVYRCNGAHFWESALTPFKGGGTYSTVVTLDARA